jgi:glycerol kinase
MTDYILALDQGTTSSRALVFDRSGALVALAAHELPQHFPEPGWVEHDPQEIFETQLRSMHDAVARARIGYGEIAAIGITNQRETALIWDRVTGEPIHRAICWQSRQTVPLCRELSEAGLDALFQSRTGLPIDAYFSGTKLRFILDAVPGASARAVSGELACGTVDTWLVYKLTGQRVHATDYSNASRTLLYDIYRRRWDPELLDALRLPGCMLPEVRDSSGSFGATDPALTGGAAIPILGVAGDQQAALFGHGCTATSDTKNTYGTGCFLLSNIGREPRASTSGLVTTIAWGIGGEVDYALEGSVFIAGACVQWLRDQLGVIRDAAETDGLARSVPDNGGVYLVPAFTGLGAPYWDPDARGALVGLTRGTSRAHVVRAALEAIAYQTRDVVGCLERDTGRALTELRVDGGATANDFLMQMQADILGVPVACAPIAETTALGAARLAALGAGLVDQDVLAKGWPASPAAPRLFTPMAAPAEREALYAGWQAAVSRARSVRPAPAGVA